MIRRFTKSIYSRKPGSPQGQGIEILPSTKDTKDEAGTVISREGRVTIRFFKFAETGGRTSRTAEIRFVLDPVEAHALSRKIADIAGKGEGKYFTSPHRFTNESGVQTESKLGVEKWGDPGAGGYAIQVFRGDERINISMNEDTFRYVGDLLAAASMEQSYNEWLGGAQSAAARE